MGKRGPGAKPARAKAEADAPGRNRRRSWERPGLTRAQRVIAFVESLKLTSGKHAGKRFRLRAWQRQIVEGIYRTERGRRVTRTAVVSLPRGQGKTQRKRSAEALCGAA